MHANPRSPTPLAQFRAPLAPVPRSPARLVASAVGLAALLLGAGVLAEETEQDDELAEETITVVATRTERPLEDVAASVLVKTAEQIEEELARDIADLVRFEPGVSVAGAGSRFGLAGFSIRGLGGNRVLTLVDGVRLPDEFSFGPFLSARRDFVDIDSLRRMEIVRGPASALYGSDALGGVVAYKTQGPRDLLGEGRRFSATAKTGYSSVDDSLVGTFKAAAGQGPFAAMALFTRRSGGETENQGAIGGEGPARERPDPQSMDQDNLAAKLSYAPSDAHAVTLGVDRYENDSATRILSDSGIVVFGTRVDRRDADDSRRRTRWSLRYELRADALVADALQATIYAQRSNTSQLTTEDRTPPRRAMQSRWRSSRYRQRIHGLAAQLDKTFATGGVEHHLSYGVDWYVTRNATIRDGATVDAHGRPVREFTPLPTRDFPSTEVTQTAAFAQNEMTLLDGALTITPGLRFDRAEADVTADAIYLGGNPGSLPPADFQGSDVTAKLSVLYRWTDRFSAYASYNEGFRAPPYDDVNVGFSNFIGGYKTLAAPDLESERSRAGELGLRYGSDVASFGLSLFRTDYDDFIEPLVLSPMFRASRGIDPADGLLTFQSINRDRVRVQGAEFSGAARFQAGDAGVSLRAAIAYADGEDLASGAPLNGIEPLSATFGLSLEAPSGRWGAQLLWTLAQGKKASDIDQAAPRQETAGYGVLDLLAHVDLGERLRLNAGLFNVTDKTYLRWADTAGIGADAPARFTQPGFNAGVSARLDF